MPTLRGRKSSVETRIMSKELKEQAVSLFELKIFGLCSWLGEKLGIRATTIRMYFIYLSFFTFGSPIILYLIGSFFLEHKAYFKKWFAPKRRSVWDL